MKVFFQKSFLSIVVLAVFWVFAVATSPAPPPNVPLKVEIENTQSEIKMKILEKKSFKYIHFKVEGHFFLIDEKNPMISKNPIILPIESLQTIEKQSLPRLGQKQELKIYFMMADEKSSAYIQTLIDY